jgi:hypothetical protein
MTEDEHRHLALGQLIARGKPFVWVEGQEDGSATLNLHFGDGQDAWGVFRQMERARASINQEKAD